MREKARKLPIGKCYIAPSDWKESGLAHVIITRQRPDGHIVMGTFLVDTFCLGVKDVTYNEGMPTFLFEDFLRNISNRLGLEEIRYTEAHNIIYGAMAFAEEGGINLYLLQIASIRP